MLKLTGRVLWYECWMNWNSVTVRDRRRHWKEKEELNNLIIFANDHVWHLVLILPNHCCCGNMYWLGWVLVCTRGVWSGCEVWIMFNGWDIVMERCGQVMRFGQCSVAGTLLKRGTVRLWGVASVQWVGHHYGTVLSCWWLKVAGVVCFAVGDM